MPLLQEIPAPVTIKARLLFAMYEDKSVRRGSITSVGSEIAILNFILTMTLTKGKEKEKVFFFLRSCNYYFFSSSENFFYEQRRLL